MLNGSGSSRKRAWIVSADMGYGHQRAVYPLREIAEDGIISVGRNDAAPGLEKRLWSRLLGIYEGFSRARSLPFIGKPLFGILEAFMYIPAYYPIRNLTKTTFQVKLLASFIRQGLCSGMLQKISAPRLPLITSFYAPAMAADMNGIERIYCIICDADLNRIWVAQEPWESRVQYFAPCGKAAQRLQAYGVPRERIHLTGFPLPDELLGGRDLPTLKADLAQRLFYLDPKSRFWSLHRKEVEHFLGAEHCIPGSSRPLTISYAVGGAGAQKEIGGKIASSLRSRIRNGEVRLNLIAGTRPEVRAYFEGVGGDVDPGGKGITVIWDQTIAGYFDKFNAAMRTTDILWTKPSELSFYSALGLPIIMAPIIGSQEYFNRKWLREIQAGVKQENPEFTDQWLFDMLDDGRFAEMAWAGFLKARKLGTYKILDILDEGKITNEYSPLTR